MNAYTACENCRHRNYASARFCAQCGSSLSRICQDCHAPVQVSDIHCHQCGSKLEVAAQGQGAAERPADGSLFGEHLERRQVTVQFCDLCGSTDLSGRLDPEDLVQVLRLYQDACTPILQAHDGYISRYMGDGILTLFGFPTAHDDAAFRAVVAGLEIVEHFMIHPITINNNSWNLSVRIGVATGMVLAGDLIGTEHSSEQTVVGQTPNLAARLQGVAVENSVVISERTHRLVSRRISCSKLAPLTLKGFSGQIDAYRALHLTPITGMKHIYPESSSPGRFVNRLREMSCLLNAWENTKNSNGQTVLIKAEPGMGKSRLLQEFVDCIGHDQLLLISLECSSNTSNTPLHPLIALLLDDSMYWSNNLFSRLAESGFSEESASVALILDDLIKALKQQNSDSINELPVQKQPSDLFIDLVQFVSRYVPVALCLEDAHWADPTTLSIVERIATHISNKRVLSVLLARPHVDLETWMPDLIIELDPLDQNNACQIINNQVEFESLPQPLLDVILSKSEGVPLFIEEVTNELVEYRARSQSNSSTATADSSDFKVPDTLRDLLMARLDSLGNAKRIAQYASVIGRVFTLDSITRLSSIPIAKSLLWMNTLLISGLIQKVESSQGDSFQFKHALIQDVAYESLTRSQKTSLHTTMAQLLQQAADQDALKVPEQIADHYQSAGQPEKAAQWWNQASGNALRMSANREALHHAREGIGLLDQIAHSTKRDRLSLSLHIYLSAAIASTRGDATPELEAIHATAAELLQRVEDDDLAFALNREMHAFFLIRGPVQRACELGRTLLKLAEIRQQPQNRLDSLRTLGWTYFCHGQLVEGRDLLKLSTLVYRQADSRLHTQHDTIDPGAVGMVNLAWAETLLANDTQAKKLVIRATRLAAEIEHPYSLAYALCLGGAVHQCHNDPEQTLHLVDQALSIADKNEYLYWTAWGSVLRGWALCTSSQTSDGLELIQSGQTQYEATGARLFMPHILSLHADALIQNNQVNAARELLDRAITVAEENGIYFYTSETYRLQAIVHDKLKKHREASRLFEKAASLADQQGAIAFARRIEADIADRSSDIELS